ncbi:MAG: histidinol dehydrogenase [Acidimicrobiaceae bacterium]|nr:histidinol dehydrogenase [Acidimicrobiaceae bacterium]
MLSRIDLRDSKGLIAGQLPRPALKTEDRVEAVRNIIIEVRRRGDEALIDFTKQFDGVEFPSLTVSESDIAAAAERVAQATPEVHEALAAAVRNVKDYHRGQVPNDAEHVRQGLSIREIHRPVARAGCYVPGGRAVYPSTVIMTTVPAIIAGVSEIALAVPPGPDGFIPDVTLAAAAVAGVNEIHPVGGAQAIAALAYGTESIRPVDVIAGPGNVWVTLAQREVADFVGVPSAFAGPSEVMVVADSTVDSTFVAVDIVLQAEHGPDGLAWLVTWDPVTAESVEAEVARVVAAADRREEITSTLRSNGYSVLCASPDQALQVVNQVAPEHLELMVDTPEDLLPQVFNAGAVFCGPWSPSSLGDYAAGPNHVLPTNGTARFASALGVRDFCKSIHVVQASQAGLKHLAPHVIALATAEGLHAHADSVRLRVTASAEGSPRFKTGMTTSQTPTSAPQAREAIALMSGYHSPQVDVEVRLNTNESPYLPPLELTDCLVETVRSVNWNRYPDRQATELRKRVAELHNVRVDEVFVANGSNEVLQSVLLAYSAVGRSTVVFEPTYAMHSHLIRVTGSKLLQGERLKNFALDVRKAVELIKTEKPSLTFLCSPNNPTGLAEPLETVVEVLDAVRSVNGLLCLDEAYGEFTRRSALELFAEDPSIPLLVTRTYSKAWSMAAIRLGYLIGPTWAVEELRKVVLPYHLDSVKQAIGIAALRHRDAMCDRVKAISAGRDQIMSGLTALPVRFWPSEANFVLFQVQHKSAGEVWHELVERSVLVRDCSSWPHFDGCLRVTVGTPEENQRFLSTLSEILK